MISKELLKELQVIIREEYGKELEMKQISEIGNTLVKYFELLAKIDYEDKKVVYE